MMKKNRRININDKCTLRENAHLQCNSECQVFVEYFHIHSHTTHNIHIENLLLLLLLLLNLNTQLISISSVCILHVLREPILSIFSTSTFIAYQYTK